MNTIYKLNTVRSVLWSIILVLTIHSASVFSMPTFARQYKHQYGYIPSCHACHKEGGGTPLNQYGQDFKDKGKNNAAFERISMLDSDNDGFNNDLEARKKSNPGNVKSTPSNLGDWLDLSSLIPKTVQVLFPKAEAWKPLDALLTHDDIIRAKSMDAILSIEDENTIYIPVANRRPIGTALIFPAWYQNKTFFLLITTDRELNISKVMPLNADQLPVKVNPQLFQSFIGTPLQAVKSDNGNSIEASIRLAVKKASTLIYIRLKGA